MARRVVALGPGSPDAVPALALEELVRVGSADVRCDAELCALLAERGVAHDPTAALIAAVDRDAWLLARSEPALETIPERPELAARAAAQSLAALWGITVRLRADCPWDREQTPATIVPHTIEEAYEVADAALAGPPGPKLVDELGDLLFQSFILALMAAEAGAGDLGDVADDRDVRLAVLPDLRRVDIRVDDRCIRRERGQLPGDAVIESRSEGDE